MNIKEFFKLLKMDVHRYGFEGESKKAFLLSPSMMITFWLRIGSWLQSKKNLFAKIAIIPVKTIYKFNALLTGIQFPIGTQLFFFFGGCLWVLTLLWNSNSRKCCRWRKLYNPSRCNNWSSI